MKNYGSSPTLRFWRDMPRRSYLLFLTAVFCFFATFGFIADIRTMGGGSARDLALEVVLSGVTAVAWVVAATRSRWVLALAVPLLAFSIAREPGAPAAAADIQRLQIDTSATAIGILLGYACFTYFAATEGRRYLRVQTEMALARDIHATLAPPIERRLGEFEFFGISLPSSEVGGDLVDLVGSDGLWMAYVADVSGHGVASGTLMAMFKSAARSQLMIRMDPQALLTDLNQVILELKSTSMFITCCCLAYQKDAGMRFTLAGHLPILHYRAATGGVDELSIRHLPLGLFEGQRYETDSVRCERGDVFALVTDGLTEVFDGADAEFGLAGVKAALAASAGRPLRDIFQHVIGEVRRHGPQMDDQSVLLVRCH